MTDRSPFADGTDPDRVPAERVVAWSIERFGAGGLVITSAFGLEGCVLIDLYARTGAPVTITHLDTGLAFPETLALRDRLVGRYPTLRFEDRLPALSLPEQAARYGEALWAREPDRCCALRKVAPLAEALHGASAWVTAVTRVQSAARAATPVVGWDWRFEIVKVAPLATWSRERIRRYVVDHDVPSNPLHERGYPSIGCRPCTTAVDGVAPDQYSRDGRWAGRDKTECGLHRAPPPARHAP